MRYLNTLSILCLLLNLSNPALASTPGDETKEAEDAAVPTSSLASRASERHISSTPVEAATSDNLEAVFATINHESAEVKNALEQLGISLNRHISNLRDAGEIELMQEFQNNMATHTRFTGIHSRADSKLLSLYQEAQRAREQNKVKIYDGKIRSLKSLQDLYNEMRIKIQIPLAEISEYERRLAELSAARELTAQLRRERELEEQVRREVEAELRRLEAERSQRKDAYDGKGAAG